MTHPKTPLGLVFAAALSLAVIGCGGSGGNNTASETIVSTPGLDGRILIDPGGDMADSTLPIFIGHNPNPSGIGLVSFPLTQLTGINPGQIVSAFLTIECIEVMGAFSAQYSHVEFGDTFPPDRTAIMTLEPNFATDPGLLPGIRTVDVSAQLVADLTAGRERSQFQLSSIGVDPAVMNLFANFNDGEDIAMSGNVPTLVVTFNTN